MRKIVCVLIVAHLNLLGCAGAPIGFGGTYEVTDASPDSITISYDAVLSSLKAVSSVADKHCAEYGRAARPEILYKDKMTYGLIRTYTFLCKDPEEPQIAMREAWSHHQGSAHFQERKEMAFYSNPAGATIVTRAAGGDEGEKAICKTPCRVVFDDGVFGNRPELVSVVGAKWESGVYRWVTIYIARGINEHFTFERPNIGGDIGLDQRIGSKIQRESDRTTSGQDVVAALLLGAFFWASYKGYYGSGGVGGIPLPLGDRETADRRSLRGPALEQGGSGKCMHDYQCGFNMKCVRAPLEQTGICIALVDEWGIEQRYERRPDSIHLNIKTQGTCQFDIDCPLQFKCDQHYRVCVQR